MCIGSVRFFRKLIKVALFYVLPICLVLLITVSASFILTVRHLGNKICFLEEIIAELQVLDSNFPVVDSDLVLTEETLPNPSLIREMTETEQVLKSSYADFLPHFRRVDQPDEITETGRVAYLTFDDGPSQRTSEILDILEKYDVKATFFIINSHDMHSAEILQRIVN